MTKASLLLICASVLLSAVAQIVLKAGMSTPAVMRAMTPSDRWGVIAAAISSSPLVWVGLAVYFASAVVWLLVLARTQVSLAYPFVGLGFVVTMLLGWLLHGDDLSLPRVTGTLLIAAGAVLVGRS